MPPPSPSIRIGLEPADPAGVDSLLRSLPAWFGIDEAIVECVAPAARLPTYLARDADGTPIGVLLLERHFPDAAEVLVMAVAQTHHRAGIGRALLRAAEADLIADSVRLLQVKTLGPSRPDENYVRTRLFYQTSGFQPLEEIHGLWGVNPCLLMVKILT